jgi:Sulfotransferase family
MYAFVHIEKTAGTTLNGILRRSFGTRHCDIRLPLAKRLEDRDDPRSIVEAEDLCRVRRLYRNLRGIAGHHVKSYTDLRAKFPEIEFFTFLRNPVSRFRSHFLHFAPNHTQEAFESWIAVDRVHNWQTRMIAGEGNAQRAIDVIGEKYGFVGLTERFDESLLLLRHWLREPTLQVQYRSLNRTSEKRTPRDVARSKIDMSYLDLASVRARIQEANAEDQKVYDFVASLVFPRQAAAYDGNLQLECQELQRKNQTASAPKEPFSSSFMRNWVYKPLLHFRMI